MGFTSGIAVIIFSSQIKEFFGLSVQTVPADFIEKWQVYALNFDQINFYAVAIALGTLLISFNFHRITTKIPGSIIAILLCTLLVYWFKLPVNTIESTFGDIPNRISLPSIPHIDYETVKALIQPAFAIALLGGIESLLSAVVADGMIGGRHRSNAELVAQGAANCFSAMFGGIPATGAIARTATNVKNGGRTPIAGIVHALALLLIMIFLAPLAKLIPMACLAGILIVVAYHMSEWRQFKSIMMGNKADILILLVTFFLTVLFDLVLAIEIGIVLSSFTLMKRMSESITIQNAAALLPDKNGDVENLFEDELPPLPKDVAIFEISGALFFGAAQTFQDTIIRLHNQPRVLILRMRHVLFIDATGIYRLKEVIRQFNQQGVSILLSGVGPQLREDIEKSDLHTVLQKDHICNNIDQCLLRANDILEEHAARQHPKK